MPADTGLSKALRKAAANKIHVDIYITEHVRIESLKALSELIKCLGDNPWDPAPSAMSPFSLSKEQFDIVKGYTPLQLENHKKRYDGFNYIVDSMRDKYGSDFSTPLYKLYELEQQLFTDGINYREIVESQLRENDEIEVSIPFSDEDTKLAKERLDSGDYEEDINRAIENGTYYEYGYTAETAIRDLTFLNQLYINYVSKYEVISNSSARRRYLVGDSLVEVLKTEGKVDLEGFLRPVKEGGVGLSKSIFYKYISESSTKMRQKYMFVKTVDNIKNYYANKVNNTIEVFVTDADVVEARRAGGKLYDSADEIERGWFREHSDWAKALDTTSFDNFSIHELAYGHMKDLNLDTYVANVKQAINYDYTAAKRAAEANDENTMRLINLAQYKDSVKNGTNYVSKSHHRADKPPMIKDEDFAYGVLVKTSKDAISLGQGTKENIIYTVLDQEVCDGDNALVTLSDGRTVIAEVDILQPTDDVPLMMWINIRKDSEPGARKYENIVFDEFGTHPVDPERASEDPYFELSIKRMDKLLNYRFERKDEL
jgi:hypothetical protein